MAYVGSRPSRIAGLSELLHGQDPRCAIPSALPGLLASLGGIRNALRRGQKTLAPSVPATPAPETSSLFRLLRMPPAPLHQLQSARARLRAIHSEFRVPRDLLHSVHSEFLIPLGFCTPSSLRSSWPLHTIPLGIPCLPGPSHTLCTELIPCPSGLKRTPRLKTAGPRHTLGP